MFSANLPEMLPFSAACEARLFYQPFAARLKLKPCPVTRHKTTKRSLRPVNA
jgi:hypothetical protein